MRGQRLTINGERTQRRHIMASPTKCHRQKSQSQSKFLQGKKHIWGVKTEFTNPKYTFMNYKFKSLLFLITTCLTSVATMAQTITATESANIQGPRDTLFSSVDHETTPYRIPAIATMSNGNVIAISDYRPDGEDIGNGVVELRARISTGNGVSWGEEKTIMSTSINSDSEEGYGDAAVVADRNSGDVMVLCVGGNTFFGSAKTSSNYRIYRLDNSNNGEGDWTATNLTSTFKGSSSLLSSKDVAAMFFASGRILQSRVATKEVTGGTHDRIYAALLTRENVKTTLFWTTADQYNYVFYSDDFGKNWKMLGTGSCISSGDEAKVEELPNGNIVISSKKDSKRGFNLYSFTNIKTAEGSWKGETTGLSNKDSGTNGELLLYQGATNVSTGATADVMLHSLPITSSREDVSVYYQAVSGSTDVSTFAGGWTKGATIENGESAYSTMDILRNGKIGFLYEDDYFTDDDNSNKYAGGGTANIVYVPLTIEEATAFQYTLKAAQPTISPASCEFESSMTVSIACETEDVKIYYTTDGTDPTTSSTSAVYSEPISITATTTVRAYAARNGYKHSNSPVASATYTINEETTTPDPVDPTFTLSTTTAELTVGGTVQLQYTSNSEGTVTYASSNTAVATVDANSGKVTAVGKGTATITATQVADGNYTAATATCTITVNPANPTFTLSTTTAELTVGETLQLSLTNTSDGTVTYTSGKTAVATVDANGVVTAVAEGTATIKASVTATNKYNAAEATCTITVKAAAVEPDPEEPETPDTPELTTITVTAKSGKIGNSTYYVATFSHEKPMTVPNGVKAYYVKAAGSDEVTLTRVTSGKAIPAGQGVILISTSTGTFVMTESDGTNVADLTDNLLKATLNNGTMTFTANDYVLAVKGSGDWKGYFAFCKTAAGTVVENYANRAYLQLSTSEANIRMRFDDDATGIGSIENDADKTTVYYDLMGRRVDNPTKGIYIVNGKKVLVR